MGKACCLVVAVVAAAAAVVVAVVVVVVVVCSDWCSDIGENKKMVYSVYCFPLSFILPSTMAWWRKGG